MSTDFSCKKFKIIFFDNNIIINHSHMLDYSQWNWNLQSKHDMFSTVDSNLEREFHFSWAQATHSSRNQQRKCEKKNKWVSWINEIWWCDFYFSDSQNNCI